MFPMILSTEMLNADKSVFAILSMADSVLVEMTDFDTSSSSSSEWVTPAGGFLDESDCVPVLLFLLGAIEMLSVSCSDACE